ncbi:MAG: tetratricopeptide repeat protein [Planctomycetia bacterium]|nr:tetratricopeptide repeat protein [Planctomycetia bacterium]
MLAALALVLLYGGGIAAGTITLRSEHLRDDGRFHVAVLLWCVLTGGLFQHANGMSWTGVVAVVPAGLIYGASVAYFFAVWVVRMRTMALGDHKLRVEPTFDQAEAAERRGDMDAAIRLYRASAMGNPGHAESRRRLGEAYLKSGDADQGIAELRAALGLVEDPEKKMALGFRVADLLVEKKGDAFNADLVLRELERDYEGTRVAELAKARRARLPAPG